MGMPFLRQDTEPVPAPYARELDTLRHQLTRYMGTRLSEPGQKAISGLYGLLSKISNGEELTPQDTFWARDRHAKMLNLEIETDTLITAYHAHQEAMRDARHEAFEGARDELRFAHQVLDRRIERYLKDTAVRDTDKRDLLYVSYLADTMKNGADVSPAQLLQARKAVARFQLAPDMGYLVDSYDTFTKHLRRLSVPVEEGEIIIDEGYDLKLAALGTGVGRYSDITIDHSDFQDEETPLPAPYVKDEFELAMEELLADYRETPKPAPVADDVVLFQTGLPEDTIDDVLTTLSMMGSRHVTDVPEYDAIEISYDEETQDNVPPPENVTYTIDDTITEVYEIGLDDIEDAQTELLATALMRLRRERYALMGAPLSDAELRDEVICYIAENGGLDRKAELHAKERLALDEFHALYDELSLEPGIRFAREPTMYLIGNFAPQ